MGGCRWTRYPRIFGFEPLSPRHGPPPLVPSDVDSDFDVVQVSVHSGTDAIMDLLDEDAKLGVPTDDWD